MSESPLVCHGSLERGSNPQGPKSTPCRSRRSDQPNEGQRFPFPPSTANGDSLGRDYSTMPTAPPIACPCGGRRASGEPCDRCGKGGKAERKRYDRERGSAAARGYDYQWQQFRKQYLAQHPLCVDCEAKGIVTAATDVHHVEKLCDAPERKYDEENLMPLCGSCHDARTAKGE